MNPIANVQFLVEIDGIAESGFCQVSGVESALELVRGQSGPRNPALAPSKPGDVSYSPVTLQRAATADHELWRWYRQGIGGRPEKRSVTVTILNADLEPVFTVRMRGAWPRRWKLSTLDACEAEVLVEEVELAIESFDLA